MTWATAMKRPHAKVTDRRRPTTVAVWPNATWRAASVQTKGSGVARFAHGPDALPSCEPGNDEGRQGICPPPAEQHVRGERAEDAEAQAAVEKGHRCFGVKRTAVDRACRPALRRSECEHHDG